MRDWFLIPVLVIIFIFTYFAVNRFRVLGQLGHQKKRNNPNKKCRIRIGSEDHALLGHINPALEYCVEALPHVEFSTNCENYHALFRRLKEETLEIALIAGIHKEEIPAEFLFIPIPTLPTTGNGTKTSSRPDPKESPKVTAGTGEVSDDQRKTSPAQEKNNSGFVVWNSLRESAERDRIISMIENEYCTLQCGYCNY